MFIPGLKSEPVIDVNEMKMIGMHNKVSVGDKLCDEMSLKVYEHFKSLNKEILYDDTNESTGSKLASMDLIGIPYQIIVGPRLAKDGKCEIKKRSNGEKHIVDFENLIKLVI